MKARELTRKVEIFKTQTVDDGFGGLILEEVGQIVGW